MLISVTYKDFIKKHCDFNDIPHKWQKCVFQISNQTKYQTSQLQYDLIRNQKTEKLFQMHSLNIRLKRFEPLHIMVIPMTIFSIIAVNRSSINYTKRKRRHMLQLEK